MPVATGKDAVHGAGCARAVATVTLEIRNHGAGRELEHLTRFRAPHGINPIVAQHKLIVTVWVGPHHLATIGRDRNERLSLWACEIDATGIGFDVRRTRKTLRMYLGKVVFTQGEYQIRIGALPIDVSILGIYPRKKVLVTIDIDPSVHHTHGAAVDWNL